MEKRAYSIKEGCQYTGIKRTRFYLAISEGDLSTIKIGRRTLILREELDRFLNSAPKGV